MTRPATRVAVLISGEGSNLQALIDAERAEQLAARIVAVVLAPHEPNLIVLAGFMRVLGPAFVSQFAGRMLNIHPSLLPKYPGLDTHGRALEAGERWHGATVHFVTREL